MSVKQTSKTEFSTVKPPASHPGASEISDWERIARSDAFREMVAAKARFIVPATIFFVVYYFALPILVGYAPALMSRPVIGPVNIAYLFALSQFFVAWIIAFLYVRASSRFDRMGEDILKTLQNKRGGVKL